MGAYSESPDRKKIQKIIETEKRQRQMYSHGERFFCRRGRFRRCKRILTGEYREHDLEIIRNQS